MTPTISRTGIGHGAPPWGEVATVPPSAPDHEGISIVSETEADVTYEATWGEVLDEDGYEWKAGGNNEEWTRPEDSEWGTLPKDTTSVQFTVPRQAEDVESFFCVRSFNEAGASENTCYGFTLAATEATTVPADPTDLTATTVDDDRIDLAWTDNADNEEAYKVHRSTTQGFTPDASNEVSGGLSADTTSYSDTGLDPETTYYYRVIASNSVGDSGASNEASATTDAAPTGGGAMDFEFDPDDYSTQTELEEAAIFDSAEIGGDYNLDTSVGYPGGSHTMRYDYVDQGCDVIGIGREISFSQRSKEVWIECICKFSSNFTDNNPDCDSAEHGPGDFKFVFGTIRPSDGRFDCLLSRGVRMSGPLNDDTTPDPSQWVITHADDGTQIQTNKDANTILKMRITSFGISENSELFDNTWHTFRWHYRCPSSAGAYDGLVEMWVDGEFRGSVEGWTSNDVEIKGVAVGRNKDLGQNPPSEEYLWWGPVRGWLEDPGW